MHQLSPCDPLRIYVPHDTDLKQKIIYKLHDALSSSHLNFDKYSSECQMNCNDSTRSSDPAGAEVVTNQKRIKSESQHKFSVLKRKKRCEEKKDAPSLAATTHDRLLGGVLGEVDA